MVAKISVGSSLYGAIAYNGEKINEAQGRLLTTNRIYNDGSGTVDIGKAMEGFLTFLPPQMKIEKPVVHISLNPHPEDVLTILSCRISPASIWKNSVSETSLILYSSTRTSTATTCTS